MLSKKHCLLLADENIKNNLRVLEKSEYLGFICNLNILRMLLKKKSLILYSLAGLMPSFYKSSLPFYLPLPSSKNVPSCQEKGLFDS